MQQNPTEKITPQDLVDLLRQLVEQKGGTEIKA